jgi:hypothetical protein
MTIRGYTALLLFCAGALGCQTPERQAPSFATGFDVPESDGILIEWHGCVEPEPCMTGEAGATPFRLAFKDSPAVVTGALGDRKVRLELDPDAVFRLGDHVLELLYVEKETGLRLELTWNELDQVPIGYALITE